MKILSRYLLREHRAPFLFAFGALTGLLVLNQLARQFGDLVGKGLPWSVIGRVFLLSVPFIIAMTVPMAVLVAVLHAFTRMGADNEVTALKASGVDLVRLVRPVLFASVVLAAVTFAFVDQVLPRTNHQLKNLEIDIARKKPTFQLKEQMVNEVVPQSLYLRAGRIDQATDRLKEVVIYDLGHEARRRTIHADSGYMSFNADHTDLYLTLYQGYVNDYDRAQSSVFRRIFFSTDLVRVEGVSNRLNSNINDDFRSDREMTTCAMESTVVRDLGALQRLQQDRRIFLENDTRALLGLAPRALPAGLAPPAQRRTLTSVYCGALRSALAVLHRGSPAATAPSASDTSDSSAATAAPAAPATPGRPGTRALVTGGRPTRQLATPTAGPPTLSAHLAGLLAGGGAQPQRDPADRGGNRLRSQLQMLGSQRHADQQDAAMYQVEIHKKFSIAASCIVFVLIGAPVALRFPRGGVGLVIGASVGIFGLYYVGLIGGETLADALVISPFWAMWGPNLLMTLAGLALFLRLGHEHATTRGGGWRERLTPRRTRAAA